MRGGGVRGGEEGGGVKERQCHPPTHLHATSHWSTTLLLLWCGAWAAGIDARIKFDIMSMNIYCVACLFVNTSIACVDEYNDQNESERVTINENLPQRAHHSNPFVVSSFRHTPFNAPTT